MTSTRPHLILIGGFLGAGKTSALVALADWLADQGIRAGFITNDQGGDLVDTRLLRYCGMATEEIAGGCFCCRFNELVDATQRLRAVLRPDVFVAEAVGSCTDLAATVTYPMRRLLGDECTVAPLSVMVDPARARRALDPAGGSAFTENIEYIYRKRLEEADLIVISKCDTIDAAEVADLRGALEREFPLAEVLAVSAHRSTGMAAWCRRVLFSEQQPRAPMQVDYDRYADGESRLGWLNASVRASCEAPCDGNTLLTSLAAAMQQRLLEQSASIAHLKMTLQSGDRIATINLVRDDFVPEAGVRLELPINAAVLTVNLRAEASPELLDGVLREALARMAGWSLTLDHIEAFRPGRPVPTHRDSITPPCT